MGEVIALLFTIVSAVGAQASAPPLPEVALSTFPPAALEAVARAQRDAQARPSDAKAAGALGRILQAWEQSDTAHQAYTRAQNLAPNVFDWHYLDAVVLQRLARHEEAVVELRQALKVSPDYLPARVRLAEALLETGERIESRRLFETLVTEPAAEPAAEVGLGRIAAAEGRDDDAVKHLERAVTLFPELGAAYYALARSYRALGRTADAERALAQHARFGPRWPGIEDTVLASVSALRDDGQANLQRGIRLATAGDIQGSIEAHERALVRDPSLLQAHANLVSLYGRLRNWAKAEEHYRAAIAKGFNGADAHYDYAVILAQQERWDEAADMYRKALSVNPLHVQAHNNLGQLLERHRDAEGALAEYRSAVEAQPTFRLGRFNLGRMLLVLGKPGDAIREFQAIQQPVDAETPRYMFALSTALVRAGRTEEGIKAGSEAQRLAVQFNQPDLAAAIARELAKLK